MTIGRPNAVGKKTELPKSEKFDTRTSCMQLSARLMTKSARLSGDIPRLYVCDDEAGVAKESRRIKIGSYRNRMRIPLEHKT